MDGTYSREKCPPLHSFPGTTIFTKDAMSCKLPVQIFFPSFSRIAIYLLSDDIKSTTVQETYDWMAEKNLDG